MPRYLIERTFPEADEDMLQAIGTRSRMLIEEQFPEITWEHSHVVVDDDGNTKSFCIYSAPDIELVRSHAGALGHHRLEQIYEIGGDISPSDFPPR